jgi:hypothetical protein
LRLPDEVPAEERGALVDAALGLPASRGTRKTSSTCPAGAIFALMLVGAALTLRGHEKC